MFRCIFLDRNKEEIEIIENNYRETLERNDFFVGDYVGTGFFIDVPGTSYKIYIRDDFMQYKGEKLNKLATNFHNNYVEDEFYPILSNACIVKMYNKRLVSLNDKDIEKLNNMLNNMEDKSWSIIKEYGMN